MARFDNGGITHGSLDSNDTSRLFNNNSQPTEYSTETFFCHA